METSDKAAKTASLQRLTMASPNESDIVTMETSNDVAKTTLLQCCPTFPSQLYGDFRATLGREVATTL